MFCASGLIFGGPKGVVFRFTLCALGLVFGGTEGVGSRFHVLRSLTRFRRYGGRRVPFSCFALPELFPAVPKVSGVVFKFCALGIVFGGTTGMGSRFQVLRSLTHFWRYRGRQVPLLCFNCPDTFSTVPSASDPVIKFCAPRLVFGGTAGMGSRFQVLRSRTHFWRYRGRRIPLSCFARPNTFSAVPSASGPVFMFCVLGLVLGGPEGDGSRFQVLRARKRFRRYRGHWVPFSSFAFSDSFFAVPRALGPVFKFCLPGLFFGGTEGVSTRFHVLSS
jgi:hypothetical protein